MSGTKQSAAPSVGETNGQPGAENPYGLRVESGLSGQFLSTDDYNTALCRLKALDAPVQLFLGMFERRGAAFPTGFDLIFRGGLTDAIANELRAQGQNVPEEIVPTNYRDLMLSSADVLHSMNNQHQLLRMLDQQSVPPPELGDWHIHLAQFVFQAIDTAYPSEAGPPVVLPE
jgi:hypothetical protein